MFPMEGMKYYLWGQHWCSSGLWKQIEGAHVNHQWEISRSRCSPSRNLKGHTWTIDWRTISLWPWSREGSRETMRLPRLYWSFGNNNLEEIGGSRPLYSSPAMWSWGSRINAFLSEYNIFDILKWIFWKDNGSGKSYSNHSTMARVRIHAFYFKIWFFKGKEREVRF